MEQEHSYLARAARDLLSEQERMDALSDPVHEASFDPHYTIPNQARLKQIEAEIIFLCDDIAASVERIMNQKPPPLFHPERLARANHELNQAHGNPLFENFVEAELIDQFTGILDDVHHYAAALFNAINQSAPDFHYIFDIRTEKSDKEKSLLDDLENILSCLQELHDYRNLLQKLVKAVEATHLHVEFEERQDAYRDELAEQGYKVSEVMSRAKLLRDDLKEILALIEDDTFNPVHLRQKLAEHYFQTAEVFVNPAGRSHRLIELEREEPGALGATYQERFKKILEIFKQTLVIIGVIERTLYLLGRDHTLKYRD